ncbi:MAG: DMT family transporter [Acidobacteriota bacterium]|nr:DMT family transporter [Acidobacteriota bacterium]
MRIVVFTSLAMIAFAANSILCRLALGEGAIDAASFSALRLVSGAVALFLIVAAKGSRELRGRGSWASASMLFLYAVPFSFAYVSLDAGTGALILFGAVQLTMLVAALVWGERLHVQQWTGLSVAVAGLVFLLMPGLTAPSPTGSALMVVAGVSWGVYSLIGRGSLDPLGDTAGSFVRSVPLLLLLAFGGAPMLHASPYGVALAVCSGALTSGVGYAIWYAALRGLSAAQAGIVQLSVPVLAAAGGVLFLSEAITLRLLVSTVLILGGVALAFVKRERNHRGDAEPATETA